MKLTPSKALKEIGLLKENGCYIKSTVEYKIVETALKRLEIIDKLNEKHCEDTQNKLKALEIITEKIKKYGYLQLIEPTETYYQYIAECYEEEIEAQYNEEEFDLLKEVLK